MNAPITPEQWWNNVADIHQLRTIKHWLEEELNVSIYQVLSIEVQTDTIERPHEGQYKRFELGRFSCFVLTLLDGGKVYRSFRGGD